MAASVASASKRGSTTRWAPASSAVHDQTTGPLWYSGPGISRQPSGSTPRVGRASGSSVAGSPDTMSFGRPVEPPEVGRLPRRRDGVGQRTVLDRRVRHVAGRQALACRAARPAPRRRRPASRPARRWPAARPAGSRYDTGCGMAPSFQHAAAVDEPGDRVRERDRHHVAQADAPALQVARQPVGRRLEGRPRDRLVAAGDQHPVRGRGARSVNRRA